MRTIQCTSSPVSCMRVAVSIHPLDIQDDIPNHYHDDDECDCVEEYVNNFSH